MQKKKGEKLTSLTKKENSSQTVIIDATGKSLGRLATEVSLVLQGKNKSDFEPSRDARQPVLVKNIDKVRITGKKMTNKIYYHHSGYPGGLKETKMKELAAKKGLAEVLKKTVWGMLPKNKLRPRMIKRLKIEESNK